MDTVKGKADTHNCLLVLTERLYRTEIIIKLPFCSAACVVAALNNLERKYGELFRLVFKSITVDNGSEFADFDGMKKSVFGGDDRSAFFYCHPQSSCERGTNENINRMIRRRIPKGTPIENYSEQAIKLIEEWINDYPRLILGWKCAGDLFRREVEKLRVAYPEFLDDTS
ncbi:hypothetical protein FACS1894208_04100 [Clostridia bacterium]|nr:hypothetical protein FACS1894208_04100 [Clostridia bacterium]